MAAGEGARLVCLQELTLSPYFAITPDGPGAAGAEPESLPGGPTYDFAAGLAAETGVPVHASLYERADDTDALGFNTAICVAPDGTLLARTRKTHLPVTAGYYEDRYFQVGDSGYPVVEVGGALRLPDVLGRVVPGGRARTRCTARRCSSTRPRSAPSPTIRASTPNRCGSR